MADTNTDIVLPASTDKSAPGAWTLVLPDGTNGYVSVAAGAAGGLEFRYGSTVPAADQPGHPVKTNAGEPLVVPRWPGFTGNVYMRSKRDAMTLVVTSQEA